MERDKILREILSDPNIRGKYGIRDSEFNSLTSNPPYHHKIVEVLAVVINDNANHLSTSQIYKKIKNIHNIS